MNLKKVFSGCLALLLVLVVSACGANGVNGNGKVTELDLEEVKAFTNDKKTGFLYVESWLDSDKEEDQMNLKEIEDVAKAEKIDFYVFDANKLPESEFTENNVNKKILKQYSKTFGFYKDGELKGEFDFDDEQDLKTFVKEMKSNYLE
ncbi:hypothetical protein NKS27_28100 [Peribacillus frigoritolerans]|uniref:hypothetical protein n=1 Tax=Peribacillus frigoritolerans TaxID=450367 RepID=UPI00209F1F7B|nr:hypothetical protein [Peribacillus frigoritolerans]MCP1156210.1 hypothetical protein [Peribacillus frigoritolerans]